MLVNFFESPFSSSSVFIKMFGFRKKKPNFRIKKSVGLIIFKCWTIFIYWSIFPYTIQDNTNISYRITCDTNYLQLRGCNSVLANDGCVQLAVEILFIFCLTYCHKTGVLLYFTVVLNTKGMV